jgi:hypothetical protein
MKSGDAGHILWGFMILPLLKLTCIERSCLFTGCPATAEFQKYGPSSGCFPLLKIQNQNV